MQIENKCLIVSQDSTTRHNLKQLAEESEYINITYCHPSRYKEHIQHNDYGIIFLDIRDLTENACVVECSLNSQKITNYFIIADADTEDVALSLVRKGALGYFVINKPEDSSLLNTNKDMFVKLKNKNRIQKDKAKTLISFYEQIEYLLTSAVREELSKE